MNIFVWHPDWVFRNGSKQSGIKVAYARNVQNFPYYIRVEEIIYCAGVISEKDAIQLYDSHGLDPETIERISEEKVGKAIIHHVDSDVPDQ